MGSDCVHCSKCEVLSCEVGDRFGDAIIRLSIGNND